MTTVALVEVKPRFFYISRPKDSRPLSSSAAAPELSHVNARTSTLCAVLAPWVGWTSVVRLSECLPVLTLHPFWSPHALSSAANYHCRWQYSRYAGTTGLCGTGAAGGPQDARVLQEGAERCDPGFAGDTWRGIAAESRHGRRDRASVGHELYAGNKQSFLSPRRACSRWAGGGRSVGCSARRKRRGKRTALSCRTFPSP